MAEYRRHAFEKDWHDKVEDFIEENDLAFDSPKYFIKFCVNRYMDEFNRGLKDRDFEKFMAESSPPFDAETKKQLRDILDLDED